MLLYDGRRFPVGPAGITIGRSGENDVVLDTERASRNHARVYLDADGVYSIADLGSHHGTSLNGENFSEAARNLDSGDTISIAGQSLRFMSGSETRIASRQLSVVETRRVRLKEGRLSMGRDPANDVVLTNPNVSRFHAEVIATDGDAAELIDLGSRNGTRLDGEMVERAALAPGSQIGIGPYRLVFDGETVLARDDSGALRLEAEKIAVSVKDKRILAPASLSVEPGELVAIIGESGSGKSTLIKALAGVTAPSEGAITISGEPIASHLSDIGYVPQDEIVHAHLTIAEALSYTARLRLPQDTSAEEIDATVAHVIGELSLTDHAQTRIGSLSGGQRKRAGVAAELLSRPSLLFLDEPTTGLDPGLETKMMSLLRALADNSRAVTVITHATKNLSLCDKVAVMGRGGQLAFCGSPDDALSFFGVAESDGIYSALDDRPAMEWRQRFEGAAKNAMRARLPAAPRRPRRRERPRALPQARVLTRRYLQLMTRDRRNLALLIGQVPILALANVGLFQAGLFGRPGSPGDAIQLLFLLAITTIWLGSIDAAREIVKERSVFEREAAVGTRLGAYLASKAVVLFGLVAVQTVLFTAIVLLFRPLHEPAGAYAEVMALLVLTGFAAVGMGLLISAMVATQDQAMSINPLVLIPQLLFAGAIVPVDRMGEPAQTISAAIFAQWSFAAVGTSVDMQERIASDPTGSGAVRFGRDFFDVPFATGSLLLLAFLAAFLLCVTGVLLHSLRR